MKNSSAEFSRKPDNRLRARLPPYPWCPHILGKKIAEMTNYFNNFDIIIIYSSTNPFFLFRVCTVLSRSRNRRKTRPRLGRNTCWKRYTIIYRGCIIESALWYYWIDLVKKAWYLPLLPSIARLLRILGLSSSSLNSPVYWVWTEFRKAQQDRRTEKNGNCWRWNIFK